MVENVTLDDFDLQILRALRRDGRVSIQHLSEQVSLSPTPVARRVKKLEQAGIITGYSALIDETTLGYGVTVFTSIRLEKQVEDALAVFEDAICGFPEVVDCWLMPGTRDYLLRIVTRDMQEFEQFLVGRLTRVPGVASIESAIPLRRVKSGVSRTP